LHLSVSDLELPPDLVADQECSRELSRAKQFEIIRELERDLRAATRQVERFDEMIEYETEIAQELEYENLDLRRRILEFPTCLPSRKDLKRQIQEAEAMLQERKGGSKETSNTVSVGRRTNYV
jgi:regulator of replication initiation timing